MISVVQCETTILSFLARTFRAGQKTGQVGGNLRTDWEERLNHISPELTVNMEFDCTRPYRVSITLCSDLSTNAL